MYFNPFEVTTPHIIYALLGTFIVAFSMFSLFLRERLYIGEAIWAFIFGVIIGPYGANFFNPRSWSNGSDPDEPVDVITIEFTRIVLAVGVFAIGVELPKAYMMKHWKSLFFLLVPGTIWSWFVCAGLIYALIPGPNFLSSLAISACLTPTDPILVSVVMGGKWADKHVPAHIRHLLAAECSCSDGAAFTFLFFAFYLMTDLPNVGDAIRDWLLILWLYKVILGIVIGSFLGYSFRHLMKFCQRHDLIDRQSYVAQYFSLAMLTIGVNTLLGSDDLLAAFACGTSFAWDGFFKKQTEESVFSSVIDTLFNIAACIYVGAWMPFSQFHLKLESGVGGMGAVHVWRLVVLAVLVLSLKRLPIMMGMYRWIKNVKTWREAVFSGHFGPMGVGAIFISTFANQFLEDYIIRHPSTSTGDDQRNQIVLVRDMIQPIIAFMVLCSITTHGLSIPGFSLGKRVHSVSRTWSRRDTNGSGRAPDWTNQATLVSRREDIVINRDLEKGQGEGVPLEKTATTTSTWTLINNVDEQKEANGLTSSKETIIDPPAGPIAVTPIQNVIQSAADQDQDDFQPDGEHHQISEWKGDITVVQRNMSRSGDDVDVTIRDEPPNAGKASWTGTKLYESNRGVRGIGHSMKDGVLRRSGTRGADAELEMGDRDGMKMRPTTTDTFPADENVDEPGAVVAPSVPPAPISGPGLVPAIIVNLNLDSDYSGAHDYDYDISNDNNEDNEIREITGGREGRCVLPDSRKMVNSRLGRTSTNLTPPPSVLALPLPSPHSPPAPRSPPCTAPTSSTTPSTGYPIPISRTVTDGSSGTRHHRLEFTLGATGQGHRTPPTREGSPSRFVRFVDHVDGESGNAGNGSGNGGRKVLVVEIPPPIPYYEDERSLGVSSVEEDTETLSSAD